MINLQAEFLNAPKVLKLLKKAPEKYNYALENTINEAGKRCHILAKKSIAKKWGVMPGKLSGRSKVIKASFSGGKGAAEIKMSINATPLDHFKHTPNKAFRGPQKGGVRITSFKEAALPLPRAFVPIFNDKMILRVARDSSGKYIKTSKGKPKLERMYTSHTAHMATADSTNIPPEIEKEAQAIFNETFMKEVDEWLNTL